MIRSEEVKTYAASFNSINPLIRGGDSKTRAAPDSTTSYRYQSSNSRRWFEEPLKPGQKNIKKKYQSSNSRRWFEAGATAPFQPSLAGYQSSNSRRWFEEFKEELYCFRTISYQSSNSRRWFEDTRKRRQILIILYQSSNSRRWFEAINLALWSWRPCRINPLIRGGDSKRSNDDKGTGTWGINPLIRGGDSKWFYHGRQAKRPWVSIL